jgi:hypothetical protein
MAGLVPANHVHKCEQKTSMPAAGAGMTGYLKGHDKI